MVRGLPFVPKLNGLAMDALRPHRSLDKTPDTGVMAFPQSMLRAAELGAFPDLN